MKRFLTISLLVLMISIPVFSEDDVTRHPGYVDFNGLTGITESDTSVEIYLSKPLLKLLAAVNSDDQELKELLEKLVMIRVEIFEVNDQESGTFDKFIGDVSKKILKQKWDRLIKAREKDEHVEIFVHMDDDAINGLLIMALEKEEAVFVNIIGELDLEMMGKLGASFDIPALSDIPSGSEETTK